MIWCATTKLDLCPDPICSNNSLTLFTLIASKSLLIRALGTFLSLILCGSKDCSNKFFPYFRALDAFKFFVEFLIALLALEVLTNSSQVGFAWGYLSVMMLIVCPLSRGTLRGAKFLLILQPLQWSPISEWTANAKSIGVESFGSSTISPFGVKT